MKKHIERLRTLAETTPQAANTLAIAHAISEVATAVADALADLPPCTDCGSTQGAALPRPRKPVKKAAAANTPAV